MNILRQLSNQMPLHTFTNQLVSMSYKPQCWFLSERLKFIWFWIFYWRRLLCSHLPANWCLWARKIESDLCAATPIWCRLEMQRFLHTLPGMIQVEPGAQCKSQWLALSRARGHPNHSILPTHFKSLQNALICIFYSFYVINELSYLLLLLFVDI